MSYTLRGRLETRLAALVVTLVAAAVLAAIVHRWWPLVLGGVMAAIGVVLDVALYDRVLNYQPGWLALPLGAFELGLVVAAAHALLVPAPFWPAVALFSRRAGWRRSCSGTRCFPSCTSPTTRTAAELGRAGPALAVAALALLAGATGAGVCERPPTIYLLPLRRMHQGPLVLDERQTLVGRPGAVVRGGIKVRAGDVTIRNVAVVGGENGIDIEDARNVVLDRVSVAGFQLDGIHVRHASVAIHGCTIDSGQNAWAQGDRHLVRCRSADERGERLYRDRRPRGDRHALGGDDGDGQPRAPHQPARDFDHGDVDGDGRAQRRPRVRRGSGSTAAIVRCASSRTTS